MNDFAITHGTELFQNLDPNLSGTKLPGQSLDSFNFSSTDLSGARLDSSVLTRVDFTDTNLAGADLSNSSICTFDIPGECATFRNTDLVGSADCDMRQAANFSNVSFANAPLDFSKMQR